MIPDNDHNIMAAKKTPQKIRLHPSEMACSFSPSFEQCSNAGCLSSCPGTSGHTNVAAAYTVGTGAGFVSRELCVASCARCVFPSATASRFYHYHLQPRPPPPGPTPTRGLQHKNREERRVKTTNTFAV